MLDVLWFDVGLKTYTRLQTESRRQLRCGLM